MSWLKKLNDFFLISNLFISACVVALCQSSAILLNVDITHILPFVFFSTLFSYNFQRYVRFKSSESGFGQLQWLKQQEGLLKIISVLSFVLTLYFSFSLSLQSFYLLVPAVFITLLYPLTYTLFGRRIILREIPRIKIFLIVVVWTIVSVGLVVSESDTSFSTEVCLLMASRFFFVLSITIPFDIRDLKYDKQSMKTIPQLFGVEKSKWLALWSLAFYELLSIAHFLFVDFSVLLLIALLLTSLYVGVLIYKTNEEKNETFYTFWMEASSLLMYLLLFIIPMAFGIFVP